MESIEQLIDAYLEGEMGFQFFYNRETKEVYVPLEDEDWEDDEVSIPVPYKQSREMYEVMVHFSQQFTGEVEQQLFLALNGRKPFRAFKDAADQLQLLDQWYVFERQYAEKQIREWLIEMDI